MYHADLLQLSPFVDVTEQGSSAFGLISIELGWGGVGLRREGKRERECVSSAHHSTLYATGEQTDYINDTVDLL